MKFELEKIIPLTRARDSLGKLVDRTRRGEVFVISDRGEPVSVLLPIKEVEKMDKRQNKLKVEKIIKEMDVLAAKISRNLPKGFDSAEAIRQARKERADQILSTLK